MKNKNEEEYDDRMSIGYSGWASCERKKKREEKSIFLCSVSFYGIH
jgi:hypothetical protein